MKILPGTDDFVWITQPSKQVTQWLRRSVPSSFRYYDSETHLGWALHLKYVVDAAKLEHYFGGEVDVSRLPEDLRKFIDDTRHEWVSDTSLSASPKGDPYRTLFVLPGAPKSVVTAAWKALARDHHPDVGGDPERFKELQAAYDLIKEDW